MGNLLSSTDEDDSFIFISNSGSALRSSILTEAQSLRQEAFQLRSEAKRTSEQSQRAYHSGMKAQAKTLSIKKTDLYRQMEEKNRQAAELFFKHYNQNRPNNIIDLHGLYVSEALKYVEEKLDECRAKNISSLTIITGIGNNSPNRVAKIKPRVEKYARENALKITRYSGHIVVDLTERNRHETIGYQNTNECIIL